MTRNEPSPCQFRGSSRTPHRRPPRGSRLLHAAARVARRADRRRAGELHGARHGDRVGGGVVECPSGEPLWLPYVEVSDVGAATDRAQSLGGEVLLAPREGPEGWRSVVSTPGGGEVAFWQPKNGRR